MQIFGFSRPEKKQKFAARHAALHAAQHAALHAVRHAAVCESGFK